MSAVWAGFLVAATRPMVVPGFTRVTGSRRRASANAGGAPCRATYRNASPSVRNSVPNFASQMRTAFASRASNTGFNSPGELEITLSTSEVAICCSRDSERSSVRWRSSLSSRVFSMAMTACAAKFCTSSICLSVKGQHLLPVYGDDPDQLIILEHGHRNNCPVAAKVRTGDHERVTLAVRVALGGIENLGNLFGPCGTAERAFGIGVQRLAFARIDERRRGVVKCACVECVTFVQIERAEFRSAYIASHSPVWR